MNDESHSTAGAGWTALRSSWRSNLSRIAASAQPFELSLSDGRYDDGTRKSHSVAENTAFVTGFFRGIATKQAFSQLVASLYFVYEAMETAFTECDDEGVRALDYPQLRRRAALEEDMAYYFGPEWRDSVQPSPATRKYLSLIHISEPTRP